jgi:RNA polymerase sigma-70 factor (ECF subfamily)
LTGASIIAQKYPTLRMEVNDTVLIHRLQKRDEAVFEQVFKANYKNLHAYAFTLLKDEADAEEMVQSVFYKLWERSENLSISGSITAYLYRAVHNESLNYLKHLSVRSKHRMYVSHIHEEGGEEGSKRIYQKEVEDRIYQAMNELPEQCRTIFQMSRFEELKYKEIAEKLELSIKTVENQMGKALKLMRSKLADLMVLLLIIFNCKP